MQILLLSVFQQDEFKTRKSQYKWGSISSLKLRDPWMLSHRQTWMKKTPVLLQRTVYSSLPCQCQSMSHMWHFLEFFFEIEHLKNETDFQIG